MSDRRWSIWIDLEGFSNLYRKDPTKALLALGDLMEAIYRIGCLVYSGDAERIFAHHFGDGFVIVSDFPEDSPERPVAVAIAVMRHLIAGGIASKAAVSCGGFADVGGCYPEPIMSAAIDRHIVRLGAGLMTIIPVMGTALIAPYKLSGKRSGAVMILDERCFQTVPKCLIVRLKDPTTIDWVHSEVSLSREISARAGLRNPEVEVVERALASYISEHRLVIGDHWLQSTAEANGLQAL